MLDKGKLGKNNANVSGIPKEAEGKGKADKWQEQKEQARTIHLRRTAVGGGLCNMPHPFLGTPLFSAPHSQMQDFDFYGAHTFCNVQG